VVVSSSLHNVPRTRYARFAAFDLKSLSRSLETLDKSLETR
jgi:hypothetical protein